MHDKSFSKSTSPLRLLFIGNSATYVHDIPGTLARLAQQAGYSVEASSIVKGGAKLSYHADLTTEHGEKVLHTINDHYDIIFIQDNTRCIADETLSAESQGACLALGKAINASGAKAAIYFRPPWGYEKWGLDPLAQCKRFDEHFLTASKAINALNVYVNRAFALAIQETDFKLWGEDNAHASEQGAYLAVCVFFATVFNTSSSVLAANGLKEEDARALQAIADRIALKDECPW